MDLPMRPSTPNTVLYEDYDSNTSMAEAASSKLTHRPGTGNSLAPPPPPVIYQTPPDSAVTVTPAGRGGIWTVEGGAHAATAASKEEDAAGDDGTASLADLTSEPEDDTKILLEKEFDDFYEDRVHKSAGPVVFVSKTLGMLPVIWTEDETENECKSYFNLYTFIIFIGWVGLSILSAMRTEKVDVWPDAAIRTADNATDPIRFLSRSSMDTYLASSWIASLIALLFGVFKCRSFAEVLFGLSETDAQLELREKHYEKIKRKSLYWILFLLVLLLLHVLAFYTMLNDAGIEDPMLLLADILAHMTVFVLDLQFLHFCMVLCKRYRLVNKILLHVTKPWKTFRNDQPPNYVLQNILQHRFDQIFEPEGDMNQVKDEMAKKTGVPFDLLLKVTDEPKISKEEENTFIYQLDILRGIHADLNSLAHEVNHLLGFQILVHIITSVVFVVMFGYFFSAAMMDEEFYWPYLVLALLPAVKIFLIGHWGQVLEQQSRQPFMTICQVSSIDGSPRLERQVQKLTMQMHHQCPTLSAAGYFTLGRNMILKTIGIAVVFTFFMVKFNTVMESTSKSMMAMSSTTAAAAATT